MNNKEILQTHNEKLSINNDKLLNILQTVNELPEASEGTEEIYSTEEVKTNKTYIDGKPIYRKVFNTKFPTITHNYSTYTSTTIDITSSNVESCVSIDGIVNQNDYSQWTLNWYNHVVGASVITNIGNSATTIAIRTNCNWLTQCPITVILEYTKKTD